MDENYWGRPVHGFGDPSARLLVVGLAPAAHGANRTGRIFTGDRSGEWLYRALHKAGFSNGPVSSHPGDGLELKDVYITSVVKCAPPQNKPSRLEIDRCSKWFQEELQHLKNVKVFLALGGIALQGLWPFIDKSQMRKTSRPQFGHGNHTRLPDGRHLVLSYHPSQQNTFTKRLTEPMFDDVFELSKDLLSY